jgi:hypothetical protein
MLDNEGTRCAFNARKGCVQASLELHDFVTGAGPRPAAPPTWARSTQHGRLAMGGRACWAANLASVQNIYQIRGCKLCRQ